MGKKVIVNSTTSIATYHEYILEAFEALNLCIYFSDQAERRKAKSLGSDQYPYYSQMICRHAFLMVANALESAANALLLDLKLERQYYEELEKLNTLLKFRVYCDFKGKKLKASDSRYSRIKEVIAARNEFVHPKPKIVEYHMHRKTGGILFRTKRSKTRSFPFYFAEFRPKHCIDALDDTLKFLSWVVFDICQMDLKEGALKVGIDSYGSTGTIDYIEERYSITFDKRTFGKLNE